MKIFKKIMSVLLCVVMVVQCCGCTHKNSNTPDPARDYKDYTKNILMSVYDCLLNGDMETIRGMLSEKLRNGAHIDEQINNFIDGIGGCIKFGDKDDYHIDRTGLQKEDNVYTLIYVHTSIRTVVDNNNRLYSWLVVNYNYVDKKNPEEEGIDKIFLLDVKGYPAYYILSDKEFEEQREQETQENQY